MWFKQVVPSGKLKGLRRQNNHHQNRKDTAWRHTSTCTTGYTLIMQLRSFQEAKELLSVPSLTIQAVLHISAGVLYPEPMRTSKDRYCRVWMSSVKCLCWKQEIEEKLKKKKHQEFHKTKAKSKRTYRQCHVRIGEMYWGITNADSDQCNNYTKG